MSEDRDLVVVGVILHGGVFWAVHLSADALKTAMQLAAVTDGLEPIRLAGVTVTLVQPPTTLRAVT